MKKKLWSVLLVSVMCLSIVGCGKKAGRQDILEQVKNDTYNPVAISDASPNDPNAVDIGENGWVIETQTKDNIDPEIQDLLNHVKNFDCKMYVGYKVEDKSIKYAFTGLNNDNERTLIYVIQDTKNKCTVEIGNYEDINNIYFSTPNDAENNTEG